jgi:hypothetical protein
MSDPTHEPTAEQTEQIKTMLSESIDQMLTRLKFHEEQAAEIRASLSSLRSKLTRSGRPAASGQRRNARSRRRGAPSATAAATPVVASDAPVQ